MPCFASLPLLRSLAILDQEQYRPKLAAASVFRKRCSAAVRTLGPDKPFSESYWDENRNS